jgi:hypothetical protein
MQQTLRTKLLIGILAAIAGLGALLIHQLHVSQQASTAASKIATEREKAEQIDRDDKAAIQKIRERNAQTAAAARKQ